MPEIPFNFLSLLYCTVCLCSKQKWKTQILRLLTQNGARWNFTIQLMLGYDFNATTVSVRMSPETEIATPPPLHIFGRRGPTQKKKSSLSHCFTPDRMRTGQWNGQGPVIWAKKHLHRDPRPRAACCCRSNTLPIHSGVVTGCGTHSMYRLPPTAPWPQCPGCIADRACHSHSISARSSLASSGCCFFPSFFHDEVWPTVPWCFGSMHNTEIWIHNDCNNFYSDPCYVDLDADILTAASKPGTSSQWDSSQYHWPCMQAMTLTSTA